MNWTVKNWFVQDFKRHGHDTDEARDYDEGNVPFERLEKVYVPDEDSLEQRINIFHGQLYSLYSLYRDNRKFRLWMKSIENFTFLSTWALLVDFLNEHWFIVTATSTEIFIRAFIVSWRLCDTDNESAGYKESF